MVDRILQMSHAYKVKTPKAESSDDEEEDEIKEDSEWESSEKVGKLMAKSSSGSKQNQTMIKDEGSDISLKPLSMTGE